MFGVKIYVFIGLISLARGSEDQMYRCPDGLARNQYLKIFQGKCYRFNPTELYWTTARDRCSSEGGTLIQIRNYETQMWVLNTFNELNWQTDGIWIGAHDRDSEMDWKWVTGEPITWNYWAPGQPNCNFFCWEDCGQIRRDDRGRWHDKPCDTSGFHYSYICQYDMKPETTTTSTTTTTTLPTTTTTTTTTTTIPTTTTTTKPTTTTTTPTTTTTTPTTTTSTLPPTTTTTTQSTTTTASTTKTPESTTVQSPTTTIIHSLNGSVVNQVVSEKGSLATGELTGVVFACVLGLLALILVAGVFFFRKRKDKSKEDSMSMHFDNLTYVVRSILSGSRMSREEQHLNNQVTTGNQNIYADPDVCCPTLPPSDGSGYMSMKEPNHYSEITDQKVVDKLSVYLPKFDNSEHQKCNIAKSKLAEFDEKSAYLDACTYSKNTYDTIPENESSNNAMNEQLENNRHLYDECGSVEKGDNPTTTEEVSSNSPDVDLEDGLENSDSFDSSSLQIDLGPNVYEDMTGDSSQASNLEEVVVSFDKALDLAKGPSGYDNNLYDSNA